MLTQLIRNNEHSEWIDSFTEYEKTEYEHVISKDRHGIDKLSSARSVSYTHLYIRHRGARRFSGVNFRRNRR